MKNTTTIVAIALAAAAFGYIVEHKIITKIHHHIKIFIFGFTGDFVCSPATGVQPVRNFQLFEFLGDGVRTMQNQVSRLIFIAIMMRCRGIWNEVVVGSMKKQRRYCGFIINF